MDKLRKLLKRINPPEELKGSAMFLDTWVHALASDEGLLTLKSNIHQKTPTMRQWQHR